MIDFDNDAIDVAHEALRPYIGCHATVTLTTGEYLNAGIVAVDSYEGPHVCVREINFDDLGPHGYRATGTLHRLHVAEQIERIRICG